MADEKAVLYVWCIGDQEAHHFPLPLDEAQRIQQTLIAAFDESASPAGSVSMPNGTVLRFAAIAATRLKTG